MGYKDKRGAQTIKEQFRRELLKMAAFGESKKAAVEAGTADQKIFAHNTMKTYLRQARRYADWLEEHYPEVGKLKKSRSHVSEYLQEMCSEPESSAWTVHTAAKALGKLFGIKPEDPDYFEPPKRKRSEITRSRTRVERDRHFSETNNRELIEFCKSTGLRVSELRNLKGKNLTDRTTLLHLLDNPRLSPTYRGIIKDALAFEDVNYYVFTKGKGGRERLAPIVGPYTEQTVERIRNTKPDQKVWSHVHTSADVHSYRADYATQIYRRYARCVEDIPYDAVNLGSGKRYQSDVYVCHIDERGRKLDRRAMRLCSKALGHNRECIVADNYLRGL